MSLFGDFGRRVIAARHKQAQRQVNATLHHLDDETLKRAGIDRSKLDRNVHGAVFF